MNPLLRTAAEKGPAGGASLLDTTACFVMSLLLDACERDIGTAGATGAVAPSNRSCVLFQVDVSARNVNQRVSLVDIDADRAGLDSGEQLGS
jgi:hypothetical protein